jgi:hypothetical protein
VSLDGDAIDDVTDVQRFMVAELIGRRVDVEVIRGDRTLRLAIVPSELQDGGDR